MFGSISLATPNSTVTSSFTAFEACQVGVGDEYAVRVNGQPASSRPINLVTNDNIEIDVVAPAAGAYKFVPWTYDGNQCYFAVVCVQASDKPSLIGIYKGKMWNELPVTMGHLASKIESNGVESTLDTTSNEATPRTVDTVNILDYQGRFLFYYEPGIGAPRRRISLAAKPLGLTRMFNGATRTWENYVLLEDGFIQRIAYDWTVTKSTTAIPDAKSIWSDGTTLFVGGVNYVKVLSDLNTVSTTYSVANDTIAYGSAITTTSMFTGTTGTIYKIQNGTVTPAYTTTMAGAPTVFQNHIVFPVPEAYGLLVFSSDGTFVRKIDTGSRLPWAVSADRNTSMAVSYADSNVVDIFTSLSGTQTPTTKTFARRVTFAQQVGLTTYAHHYLRELNLTMPPNPPVTGVNFPTWTAPIGVDVGSGESRISTQATILQAAASPNAELRVNGVSNAPVIANDNRVSVMLRSEESKKSAAVVLGNYAFDFKVYAEETTSFSTAIDIPNRFVAPQVIFTITVPGEVSNAPVAISHGTLRLNGNPYNGFTPVKTGDVLTVTINVPEGRTSYWSMLSIADSQYALTISTSATSSKDTQRYQDYLSRTTKSVITVDETGEYNFPNYSFASISKGGEVLSFPTQLVTGDEIEITHTPMSAWWFDERDTVLIGPNVVYKVTGITIVDDAPDPIDFGTVRLGIPDFDFVPDQTGVISGLSDKFSVAIYSQNMKFRVNGAEAVERPLVKNGDVIEVVYNVLNMWEDRYVKNRLYDGREYEFGVVHIDPPLGVTWVGAPEILFRNTMWVEHDGEYVFEPQNPTPIFDSERPNLTLVPGFKFDHLEVASSTPASVAKWQVSVTEAGSMASTAKWQVSESPAPSIASIGRWQASEAVATTNASRSRWESNPTSPLTAAPKARYESNIAYRLFPMNLAHKYLTPASYLLSNTQPWMPISSDVFQPFDYAEAFEPAYGYSVEVHTVEKEYYHLVETEGTHFFPFFSYGVPEVIRVGNPVWARESASKAFWIDTAWKRIPIDLYGTNASTSEYIQDNALPVVIEGKFGGDDSPLPVIIRPIFDSASTALYGKNIPDIMNPSFAMVAAPTGKFVSHQHVRELTPRGGFASEAEAQQAATAYTNTLETKVFQQPEGTFSFVVKRETNLVCPIIPSLLTATRWLIGGG